MSSDWLQIRNAAQAPETEVLLYGFIGSAYEDRGVSAKKFAEAIGAIPRDREITVRIHSPGGSIFDGLAMHTTLAARRDKVTTRIDGLAASMASVIALAGKKVQMPADAKMMIHNPIGLVVGSAADMRRSAEDLDMMKRSLVNIYHGKTGKPRADIEAAMDKETWFDGPEALAFGMVDEVTKPAALSAVAFDLSMYKNSFAAAPVSLIEQFQAITDVVERNAFLVKHGGALLNETQKKLRAECREKSAFR